MNKNSVGIDAGGTLSKIVYETESGWECKKIPTVRINEITEWIRARFSYPQLHITGGKAGALLEKLSFPAKKINEFEATCEGVKWLLEKNNLTTETSPRFMVTNVGTGTSIHCVEGDYYERIGGSGMGGGTLLGLTYLLTGEDNYDNILELSKKGDSRSLNITVDDIYSHEVPPISGSLTASNFGNVAKMKSTTLSKEDYIAAVVRMVGETITTMSVQAAERLNTEAIVYIGSTFDGNETLKEIIRTYTELRGKKPFFLENGEFSGAIGALMNNGLKQVAF
ncbi:type II pantothenate kinase [Aliibacillus thermotolerans]|uniref:Type II pantothenate kinase n=1 Tax=Aliibacillus thermotolerans TaxID=1834418 RepID=A0ABW0U736_9BACI|nr:type II pantothenate kinase [Aliibacillus thermotolerans]MDA3130238.1 type II pantothenate kinase [Aliibacillus thermotolerans]